MRITNEIREKIRRDMLKHAFEKLAKEIALRAAKHASEVYRDVYTKAQCEDMSRCSPGMLPVVGKIQCQFGASYDNIHFDGWCELERDFSYIMPTHELPVWFKHKTGCVKNYEATHPLAVEYDRIKNERADLRREIKTAKSAITVALAQTSSSATLVSLWPEVAPFLVPYEKVERNVPVIQTSVLNKALGLPV